MKKSNWSCNLSTLHTASISNPLNFICNYRLPAKLWEGNVFSNVCLCTGRIHVTGVNLFKLGPTLSHGNPPALSPYLFRFVHLWKWVVGLRLKGLLVTTCIHSLWEGNVFSCVFCLFMGPLTAEGPWPLCTGPWPQSSCTEPGPGPWQHRGPQDMFKLGPHCTWTPPPRHVQTSSLWSTYCRQVSGWHPTGMFSCWKNFCTFSWCLSSVFITVRMLFTRCPWLVYKVLDIKHAPVHHYPSSPFQNTSLVRNHHIPHTLYKMPLNVSKL